MFFQFPYTDLYSLNLDWLIKAMKELQDKIEQDRGERVLSFNTRTGTVTLLAADVNALGINSVAVVPSISGMTADAISEAYESGVRILLEGSTGNYTKAGFMVSAEEGIDICMLSVDMSPVQEQIDAIQDKVNPETAAAGNVFTIDAQGNSVWAPPDATETDALKAKLNKVVPTVGAAHALIPALSYFYYNGQLRTANVDIAADAAITDSNSSVVTDAGLTDVLNNAMSAFSQLDEQINPEGGGTPGQFLQVNSQGATVWGPPATEAAIGAAVTSWLDTNVPTGTTVVVDRSLTVDGAAADAKVTGDKISDLKSQFDYTSLVNWNPVKITQYQRDTGYRVDGTSFTSDIYFSVKFAPESGKQYRLTTSVKTYSADKTMCACIFFDSQNNVISTFEIAGVGATVSLNESSLPIPSGTEYAICTSLASAMAYAKIEEAEYINYSSAYATLDDIGNSLINYPAKVINRQITDFMQGLRHGQTNARLKYDTAYLVSQHPIMFHRNDVLVFDIGSSYTMYVVDTSGAFVASNIASDYTFASDVSAYVEIKKNGITQNDITAITYKTKSIVSGQITDIENMQNSIAYIEGETNSIDYVVGYDAPGIMNGYHVINGNPTQTSSALSCCDFIKCELGDTFLLLYCQSISKYNAEKTFTANITYSNLPLYSGNERWNMWVADFSGYIRITFYNDKATKFAVTKLSTAPYHCVCLGDSIMGNRQKPYDCPTYIQNVINVKTANCGFGGTRASTHSNPVYTPLSFWSIADAIATGNWEDIDIDWNTYGDSVYRVNKDILINIAWANVKTLFVHYGTNDWSAGATIDNLENKYDKTTYKGAMRYGIERILTAYPNITIVLSSPLFRYFSQSADYSTVDEDSDTKTNINGKTLPEFVQAMEEVADEYHLPFINNYADLGMNKFNAPDFLSDGTHPSYFSGIIKIGTEMGGHLLATYSEPHFSD